MTFSTHLQMAVTPRNHSLQVRFFECPKFHQPLKRFPLPDDRLCFDVDDFLRAYGDTEYGPPDPTSELVGATTTPLLHPRYAVPEVAFLSDTSGHLATEDPIGLSQSYPPSEYGLGV